VDRRRASAGNAGSDQRSCALIHRSARRPAAPRLNGRATRRSSS
jgi:hypothetical protein